jgi:hypothetical protein
LSLNGGTLLDASGNVATLSHVAAVDNSAYLVDTTAPTVSATTASIVSSQSAVVQSTEIGTAYLVHSSVTVTNVASITSAADGLWNSVNVTTANTNTNLAATGLTTGTYKAYTADAAGNLSAASTNSVSVSVSLAGQAIISLGTGNGQLIAPVQVEGKWFYVWDRNNDGVHNGSAVTGAYAGVFDYTTMDKLEQTFFGSSAGAVITESNRTFTIGGVSVALPTAGTSLINASMPGTAWSNATPGWNTDPTSNATYNDLAAIWDAFNGTGTGTGGSGAPAGWATTRSWSATPSASGHASVTLSIGTVNDNTETNNNYVALQVL